MVSSVMRIDEIAIAGGNSLISTNKFEKRGVSAPLSFGLSRKKNLETLPDCNCF